MTLTFVNADTDPCLTAFIDEMRVRGIKAERDENGPTTFKDPRIETMWEGFVCGSIMRGDGEGKPSEAEPTDILTRLAALREHPRTSELREHIRRGYGYRAVGAERIWSLHDDEIQVLNTGFTCLDDQCKSLIALVQKAAGEIERLTSQLALADEDKEQARSDGWQQGWDAAHESEAI